MDINRLIPLQEKPEPFTPGEPLFWDHPHISKELLAAHLNPENDVASRRPGTIDLCVDWLVQILSLRPGSAVLDLGCGPGLYAARLAARGMQVTGIDYSHRSIEFARDQAQREGWVIRYRYQNYLDLEDEGLYDAALLIYGDFCPLSPGQRARLMRNVHRALKPDGSFVLDVTTPEHRKRFANRNGWYASEGGFWRPGLHLVLEEGFDYPEQSIFLDQAIVVEAGGEISVYRMWFQDYDRQTITNELEGGGFAVQGVWDDLTGTPYTDEGEWIGVIARKSIR
jgi:SAM-dependent methyltransferase